MGRDTGSRAAYTAVVDRAAQMGSATRDAEQRVRQTRKLDPLVDPGANDWGKARRSLVRFDPLPDGRFEVTVGLSVPVEIMLDTTGSMGSNVDIALQKIPDLRDNLASVMRPNCEAHIATGVFNDTDDTFSDRSPGIVMTRSQFEMTQKMAEQMLLHVPMRNGGGNGKEDSQLALFGAAYLSSFYINRIGLRSYHFTITDDAALSYIEKAQLIRVYGKDVFEAVAENGHDLDPDNLPSTNEVVQSLLTRAHAFCILVRSSDRVTRYWTELMGAERVIAIPSTDLVSEVIAVTVGLTEGTLDLLSVEAYLTERGVSPADAKAIERSVRNIPIAAQTMLPNFDKIPVRGDIFNQKTDRWPAVRAVDRTDLAADAVPQETGGWL